MRRTLQTLSSVTWKTGAISNETKIGRLAKMLQTEILMKENVAMDFSAFGDNLIGKTVRAMSLASSEGRDLQFAPFLFETAIKERASIPSMRFLIRPAVAAAEPVRTVLKVSAVATADTLGKRMHALYLQNVNKFTLRCVGDTQSAKSVLAMAIFNQKVESHKLQAALSNELVPDRSGDGKSIRAILLHVHVLPARDLESPPTIAIPSNR